MQAVSIGILTACSVLRLPFFQPTESPDRSASSFDISEFLLTLK